MQAPRQHRHFAHSGKSEDGSDCQALPEHMEGTAVRAAAGERPGLPPCAGIAGRFHDFGKYEPAFQRHLRGAPATVDHSTAGAHFLLGRAGATPLAAELLAYAILGHHAGLPDKTGCEAAMDRRIGQFALRDPIPPAVRAAQQVSLAPLLPELFTKVRPGHRGFDLSVAGRMTFSCLANADFKDTEAFQDRLEGHAATATGPRCRNCTPGSWPIWPGSRRIPA